MRDEREYISTPFDELPKQDQRPQKYLPLPVKSQRDDLRMQKLVGTNRDDLRLMFGLKKFDKEQGLSRNELHKLIGP
jgi:hypothetical protein